MDDIDNHQAHRRASPWPRRHLVVVAAMLLPFLLLPVPPGTRALVGPLFGHARPVTRPGEVAVTTSTAKGRPNVVLITSDDQNVSDLRWMPRTRRLLEAQGMRFTQALSPHPLCCPARAEILT